MKNYICVFDCETIPDADVLAEILTDDQKSECYDEVFYDEKCEILDEKELSKLTKTNKSKLKSEKKLNHKKISLAAQKLQKEKTGSEFLPICFHKIVCISAVLADEFGKFLKVETLEYGKSEKEQIEFFLNMIEKHNPRLISYNGRGFDLPMIMLRAMRYNLTCHAYFETANGELNKNKWENYRYRYNERFHMDLLDFVNDFGSARGGLNLDNICKTLGLPGKYDVHGDQVLELFYDNKLDKISEYCQSDVLNTYLLFIKTELLRGNLILSDYADCISIMKKYLCENCEQMGYFKPFNDFLEKELINFENL